MNRVYKIVWSKAKNAYVVTSELAKNHTKNASGKMVKAALTAAMGMGVLMGGYVADAAPATNPSGDGPGIAIGTGSSSQKVDSTAVGKNAKTTGESALAVGYDSIADADGAMAVGNGNKAMAGGSLAVGARNIAQGMGGLAIGENNTAEGDGSAAVGHSNKVHAMGTYAFGLQNAVWKMYSQAYGMNNIVSEANSFAYGNSNQVGSMNSFAFGGGNLNTARWAVTVGNTNKVGGEHSFAAGFYNTIGSTSKDAVAIGQNARVGVSNFNVATTIDPTTGKITAVYNGEVDATNSVAIGHEANVMALNSVALGENTGVTKDGKNGTAIGGEASVKAENGTAAGFKATVRAKSGVALGASSFVDAEGGIALGRNSVAERKSGRAGYDFTTGAVSTVNDSTWKATDGAVSVGSSANTRQITGVAAGTEDTDAVNVAQIKGLAKKIVASTADYRLVQNALVIPAFEKETGIKVNVIVAGTGPLVKRVASEKDNPQGDILWAADQTMLDSQKELFEKYVSPEDANMIDAAKNKTGYFSPAFADPTVFIVNKKLAGDMKIAGFDDLLNPALKGKIACGDPANSSSAFQVLMAMLYAKGKDGDPMSPEAWAYVDNFIKNVDGKFLNSSGAVHKGAADGEYTVGLTWEDPAATYVKNGADVEVVFPKEGAIFPGESVQIIKGAKHMENAKKFVDFMLSQKIQEAAGKTLTVRPLRKGVKLADYMTPQDTIALFKNYDESWVAAHKKEVVAEWNKHLENSRQ